MFASDASEKKEDPSAEKKSAWNALTTTYSLGGWLAWCLLTAGPTSRQISLGLWLTGSRRLCSQSLLRWCFTKPSAWEQRHFQRHFWGSVRYLAVKC